MNLYTHRHLRKNECKVFIPVALLLISIAIVVFIIGICLVENNNSLDWYWFVCGVVLLVALFLILDTACRFYGDKISNGKITYFKFLRKNIIDISKVKFVVITARWGGYLGASGTMKETASSKKSMPCLSILKDKNDYRFQYFYSHEIKDAERKNFLYSLNATEKILMEFFMSKFQGKLYILDRIYNENKDFFIKLENNLNAEHIVVYHAEPPLKETFY